MNDHSSLRGRLRITLIGPLVAVGLGILGLTPAFASPYPQGVVPDVGAWLDRALPKDAAAGTEILVGATIWSSRDNGPIGSSAVFFRLYAGDGGPDFSEVVATEDWRGHFSGNVIVPKGGVGELHIGTQGTSCDANGCTRSDAVYEIAGVGPPPMAPLTAIARAEIYPPNVRVVAGQPFPLLVVLHPGAEWEPRYFTFPATLRVVVRDPRGPDLEVVAVTEGSEPGHYHTDLTLPGEGSFALQAATAGSTGANVDPLPAAELFSTSTILVEARVPASASPSPMLPPSEPATSGADQLVPLLAALAIALVGVGGLLALRRRPG